MKIITSICNRIEKKSILICTFILGFIFLVWRAKYGFCFNDEPLCVTMAQRIYFGDGLISKEWHGIQNFGIVLYPFYYIFRLFNNTNEGLFLFLRYCYCILWELVCIYVSLFFVKKHDSIICGLLSYTYLILFSPLDYMMIFYHSVSLMAVLLICCIIVNIYDGNYKNIYVNTMAFSLLFIVLVFCLPYAAAIYIILFFTVIIISIVKKDNMGISNIRKMLLLSCPVLAVGTGLYLWFFVFSKADINVIKVGIENIFKDPQHGKRYPVNEIYRMIRHIFRETKVYFVFSLITSLFAIVVHLLKSTSNKVKINKIEHLDKILLIISTSLYIVYQIVLTRYVKRGFLNYQMMYITIIGFTIFFFLKNKPYIEFIVFGIIGVLYTYFDFLASNTEQMVICKSASVFGCLACVMLYLYIKENCNETDNSRISRLLSCAIISIALVTQIGSECATRLYRQYWDSCLLDLKYEIEVGACKGLKTSLENKTDYENKYNTLMQLLKNTDVKDKTLLCLTADPVIYVDADLKFATFSSCTFDYDKKVFEDRLNQYFTINNVRPDLVYVESKSDLISSIVEGYYEFNYNGAYLYAR